MAGMLWIAHANVGIVIPERNATTSLEYYIVTHGGRTRKLEPFKTLPKRYGFVRNPKDRFLSSYAHYLEHQGKITFSEFVSRVVPETFESSNIVKSQSAQFAPCDITDYLYWDFQAVADLVGTDLSVIEHRNKSVVPSVKWSKEAQNVFEKFYAEDIKLWGDHNGYTD